MEGDALVKAVCRFNFDPVSYSHPSWWLRGGLSKQVFGELLSHPAAAATLSRRMLFDHRLDAQFDFDFAHPFKHIAFLTYKHQRRLAFRLGLVMYHARIAALLSRKEQARLHKLLDYADYLLALRLKLGKELLVREDLPPLPLSDTLRFRSAVYLAGFTLLAKIVSVEPLGFKKRYYLTWPKQVVLARLAALQNNTLSGVKLADAAVIPAGREMVKRLLSMQEY